MKQAFTILFIITSSLCAFAQLSDDSKQLLIQYENQLDTIAAKFNNDTLLGAYYLDSTLSKRTKDSIGAYQRMKAVYQFIPTLVKALKVDGSFHYPFSKLEEVSFLYPDDSTFRIITFQRRMSLGGNKYYGCIQMNSEQLKLHVLDDRSDTVQYQTQEVLTPKNWFGAVYYNLLQVESKGKQYYTLIGYDRNDMWSRRKIIEILHFNNEENEPQFGAPLFQYTDSSGVVTHYNNRIYLEYKHDAVAYMNYDSTLGMIVFDHTEPPEKKFKGMYFMYLPDGSYEAFKFEDGYWNWVEKIFHYKREGLDNPPVPTPVLDKRD